MLSNKISLKQVNIIWMLPSGVFPVYLRPFMAPLSQIPMQIFFPKLTQKIPIGKLILIIFNNYSILFYLDSLSLNLGSKYK